jgi:hypothetical protein
VLYATEARGYSARVPFCLAAYSFLGEFLDRPALWRGAAYGVCAILALLAQLISVSFLAAAVCWTADRSLRRTRSARTAVRDVLALQTMPALCLAVLYLTDLRFIVAGGGSPTGSVIGA